MKSLSPRPGAAAGLFVAALAGLCLMAGPAFAQAAESAFDQRQDRIEELQNQLVAQTAENERLQHDLAAAQREVTRLTAMVNDMAAARDAATVVAAPAAPAPRPAAQAAPPPPATSGSAAAAAAPANSAQSPAVAAAQARAQGSLGTVSASAATPTPAATPTSDPVTSYSDARTALNSGRLAEAEDAFTAFVRDHGDAPTAPDARYWLAFTQLARNEYQPAAAGFLDYLQRYSTGPRAPEALVRLGMALGGLNRTRDACAAYRDLGRRYPRAPTNIRELATRESRALSCPAA